MAYARGSKYDVFVSYALADNAVLGEADHGWVTLFAGELRIALRQRLGAGISDDLKFFFSPQQSSGGNYTVEDFLSDARAAAVMVSVLSPSYVALRDGGQQPFAMLEVEAFLADSDACDRLFVAEVLPLSRDDILNPVLRGKRPVEFMYEASSGLKMRIEPTDLERRSTFLDKLHDLAGAISHELKKINARPTGQPTAELLGTVLLAQVTEDLDDERDQVRRHLEQFGVRILPQSGAYPADAALFEAAFAKDLSQVDMMVQLLSRAAGRSPKGYVYTQAHLAARAGKPIVQWRHPSLKLDEITDPVQRQLLEGETVLAEGLEGFKTEFVARLRALFEPKPTPQASRNGHLIFINSSEADSATSTLLDRELKKRGLNSVLPMRRGGTAQEIRKDLERSIVNCDALMLVYGSKLEWLRAQIFSYNKLKSRRERPVNWLAVYNEPPGGKEPIGINLPEIVEIGASGLDGVLARLK